MRSTFNILFYINRNKQKKNGKCPLMGKITVDGKVSQFSIKEEIEPSLWSVKKGCSIGESKSDKELNRKLKEYRQSLRVYYDRLVEENAYVTVESLKDALLKGDSHEAMLLSEFKAHNEEYLKSVGISKSKGSYYSYVHAYKSLEKFINHKYDVTDIAFRELQYSFIEDFDFFLRVNLNFAANTVFNVVMKLKYMIHRACHKGIIHKNPFADFVCKPEATTRRWLSKAELDLILQTPMKDKDAEWVRILFIFSAFTGLAFADLYNLKHKNISVDKNGITWIRINRKKTGTGSIIPMLAIPQNIYNKYKTQDINPESKVFDVPYYTLILFYLKKIKKTLGFEALNFHMSRHSYATTVCLSHGVPIETLSRMMGHKNISTTQIYAKITNKKVEEDMQILEKRIGNKYRSSQYNLPDSSQNPQKQIAI